MTRTKEGLYCHHIDEDKAIMLSNDQFAKMNPFEYQRKDRLVYCNALEHLLLHVLISEQPSAEKNEVELPGIGGAANLLCHFLNDVYTGYEFKAEYMICIANAVKDDYESYIMILRRLWNDICNDPLFSKIISKEDLAKGWNGDVYPEILDQLD